MTKTKLAGLAAAMLLLGVVRGGAEATLVTVGQGLGYDYSSIQQAISASISGDEIPVAPGIYVEGSAVYRGNELWTVLSVIVEALLQPIERNTAWVKYLAPAILP